VAQLGQELVAVVAAHQVVRYRHPDGRGRRETPACSATSDRLSFVLPLRPSTSAVAASIRWRVEPSTCTTIALQNFDEVSR
jgi:hypothetical protein